MEHFFRSGGPSAVGVNEMRDRFTGEARGFGFVGIQDLVVNEVRRIPPRS